MIRTNFLYILIVLLPILFWSCEKEDEIPDPKEEEEQEAIEIEDLGLSDLPLFSINANGKNIPNEPKIPVDYSIKENGQVSFSGRLGIELRGSTSRRLFEKKSYGFETWDENNEDIDVELLGFPKEEDWILYGPYADKTLLRNTLIYEISNQLGMYASRTKFVELVIDDEYMGVYAFMEKLKRDKARIDIKKLEAEDLDATSITGGYILKIDKTSGDNENEDWAGDAIYTAQGSFRSDFDTEGKKLPFNAFGGKKGEETYFLYEYPDSEDIVQEQRQYIQNYTREFEEALLSDNFDVVTDTRKYMDYIDVASFAQFFILNELTANPDAYRISTYLHKQRGEKLKMGPIWDFNLAFGLDDRSATNQWIYKYNEREPNDLWLVHFWWTRLLEDPIFRVEIKNQWQNYRANELSAANINSIIEAQQSSLQENQAIDRNFQRWQVLGVTLPFNSFVGKDYKEEVDYLKNWINSRLGWMDGEILSW